MAESSEAPPEPCCGTCRFWARHGYDVRDGICRRHPPAALNHGGGFADRFPVTYETTWCGEHKEKADG